MDGNEHALKQHFIWPPSSSLAGMAEENLSLLGQAVCVSNVGTFCWVV